MNIPIYNVSLEEDFLGLTAISYVDEPAIMEDFVAFKKDKPIGLYFFAGEKREVVSPVLIPNQLIYRNDGVNEFYIRWTEETIKMAFERFKDSPLINNVTIMHPSDILDEDYTSYFEDDVEMMDMWLIEDPETDIMNTQYGYNLPKGTMCVHYKVNNDELWSRIKSGELKGLSVEALVRFNKVEQKIQKMTNSNLFQKFIMFLNDVKEDIEALDTVASGDITDSGDAVIKYYVSDSDYIEVDADGLAKDMDGNTLAEGEYKLADGNILVVGADGKFVETKKMEEAEVEEPAEAPIAESKDEAKDADSKEDAKSEKDEENKEDETKEEKQEDETDAKTEDVQINIEGVDYTLPSKVADFISRLQSELDSKEEEVKQMKQTPSTTPITNTTVVEQKKENKAVTTLSDAFRKMNHKK